MNKRVEGFKYSTNDDYLFLSKKIPDDRNCFIVDFHLWSNGGIIVLHIKVKGINTLEGMKEYCNSRNSIIKHYSNVRMHYFDDV